MFVQQCYLVWLTNCLISLSMKRHLFRNTTRGLLVVLHMHTVLGNIGNVACYHITPVHCGPPLEFNHLGNEA